MKVILVLMCLIGLFSVIVSQRIRQCPRNNGPGICAITCRRDRDCRGGRVCCRTACGGRTCIRIGSPDVPWWCPRGSPKIRCLVNPCQVKTCPGRPRARCINDNPCERACSGNFYVGRGYFRRRISRSICERPRRRG